MCAIYTWMRQLDDLADDAPSPNHARQAIEQWRIQTQAVLQTDVTAPAQNSKLKTQNLLLWPAFLDTVRRYSIPRSYFDEISEGALMDQEITRYATFEELYRYCYCVASVVGLVSLRVFGYADPKAEQQGEWLGIAFQLTNILRDVSEDALRGRIYIPQENLQRYGVSERDILESRWSIPLHEVLKSFAEQAEEYYVRAALIVDLVSPEAQPTLRIMIEIYHGILSEVRKIDFRVFDHRARLPAWEKILIVLKHQIWNFGFLKLLA